VGSARLAPSNRLPRRHPDPASLRYAELILKFLLWQRGGFRAYIGGPSGIGEYLARVYSPTGARSFDHAFMGDSVYQRPFQVIACAPSDVPPAHEPEQALGRHLDGYRVGFDLGASDLKVSAVANGEAVFSEEIVWEPRRHSDPQYHYSHIVSAIRMAAEKLPRLDAIGGSAAGVYVDNRPMVASLFRGVPDDRYHLVRDMFLRIRDEFGVPLEVVNDGEVTALAGAMSLDDNAVLGLAMGSSEAAGYITPQGNVTGWLNELAFAPVDYAHEADVEEWSGDRGVGALYFSQQCVFRLAPAAGIEIPAGATDAEKLEAVQALLEAGHSGARQIWESIGVYLGYSLAHYAEFYTSEIPVRGLKHVLVLGRVTSGRGGPIILEGAQRVLDAEFPVLAAVIDVRLPDEKSRRVDSLSLPPVSRSLRAREGVRQ
jgi:predicted NBD/HSP70 family sugar kinase